LKTKVKKLGRILTTEAEMRAAIREGRKRDRTATKILAAHYDRVRDAIVVELSTGAMLSVPRRVILGFKHGSPKTLADLEIMAGKEALWSDTLDDGVLLEQLVVLAAGEEIIGMLGARINAAKKSPARAAASRANGTKGGRPRTRVA